MKRTLIVLLVVLVAGVLFVACSSSETKNAPKADTPAAAAANVVQFQAVDIDGSWRQSSEWIGKQPVILNFWGSWCPPCRREIPDLVKLYHLYQPQGVEILSLAVNDTPEKVRAYAENAGMDWVMLMGDRETLIKYGATQGVPTTIFLNKNGVEVTRFVGPRDFETFKQAFESIL